MSKLTSFFINKISQKNTIFKLKFAIALINIGCFLSISNFLTTTSLGAEKIYLSYKALEFSLSVDALETYAKQGKIEEEFRNYAKFLSEEQLESLKTGLTTNAELGPLAISQFLYSYQGEKLLERAAKVIQTTARQPGFHAIRAALILAAADRESGGLTPLNVLKKFPTEAIRIDSERGFEIIENLSKIVETNNKAIAAIEQQALDEREQIVATSNTIPNLLRPGYSRYRQQVFTINDVSRERRFPVDLYLPRSNSAKPLPLVIISHGLGSDRTTFEYFAKHLVSYGFAVAVPEHPGSNASQIQALLTGLDDDVTPPQELIDRPLDISFLLDKLEQDYGQELNTKNVGIIGQSFGAYTALAVAGAKLNLEQLEQSCENLDDSWNLSLLLQCLALELPDEQLRLNLKDPRIGAAIAINPLTSAVFGEIGMSRIKIPVMIVSGSADPITPALPEQIIPFTWLATDDKYLALLKGGTHFSALNESSGSIPVPTQAIGPDPQQAHRYIKQLGVAFFKSYIEDEEIYLSNLNAKYAARISNPILPLRLVRSLDAEIFNQPERINHKL